MAGRIPYNKILWTADQENFIKDNFHSMTNQQLADALSIKLTSVRTKCYSMGLKRMDLDYWTPEQVALLKKRWKTRGDSEIAEEFAKLWYKEKGWSKKHIEKKRRYLKLKRTEEMKASIFRRNKRLGRWSECAVKAWKNRDVNPNGTIVYWKNNSTKKPMPMIKVNDAYLNYPRFRWRELGRKIKRKHNIIQSDGNPYNLSDDNLEMVSDAELAKRNSQMSSVGLSDTYVASMIAFGKDNRGLRKTIVEQHPELIQLKRAQLLHQRALKEVKP